MPTRTRNTNAPPHTTSPEGVATYTSVADIPRVANRRLILALTVVSVLALVEGFTINHMLPLRQRIPYYLTVNQSTGQVTASNEAAKRFTPTQATERYFLAKWVTNLLQVDNGTAKTGLPASYAVLRGSALGEWNHFVFDVWKPLDRLHADPTLREYASVDSVALLGDDTAVMRVSLHDAMGKYGNPVIVTVKYAILPVQTDAQVARNPIGLWITHFDVANETVQQ